MIELRKPLNNEEISRILLDEDIWEEVRQDWMEKDMVKKLANNPLSVFLMIEDKDLDVNPIGLFSLDIQDINCYQMHISMLKKFRIPHCTKALKALFRLLLERNKYFNKIHLQIPVYKDRVIKLVQHMGFKIEGTNRESFLRDGKFHDRIMLGITRREIKNGN